MIQRLDRITLVALCVILTLAPAARGENYAVFFAGGNNDEDNWEIYYDEILRHYEHVVDKWGYKPENVWVIFADGMNPFADLTMWPPYDPENSDWSPVSTRGSTVLAATYANTQAVLTGFQQTLGPGDLFYWWSYDHGGGDKNQPAHHDEETITGWNQWESNNIGDDTFAGWVDPIGAGRHAYVLGQCYSGGILEELAIWPGSNRFGCASATHQETAQSSEAYEGFNDAWCDAVEEEDAVNTHNLYQLAYEDTDMATDGEGPNAPYSLNVQHPWKLGDDLFLPVCVWEGAGAGGSSHALEVPSNWSYAMGYERSARVELTSGASIYVDDPMTFAGYLTLNWDPSIGTGGLVLVNATGTLFCQSLDIGKGDEDMWENPGFGYLALMGGYVTVDDALVLGAFRDDAGRFDLFAGRLDVGSGFMVVGDDGVGEFNHAGGEVHLQIGNTPLYVGRRAHGHGTYRLEADLLSADVYVGFDGTGTFEQTGGAHASSGNLFVGMNDGSEGTYTLTGGTLVAQAVTVGSGVGSEGTCDFSGTSVSVTTLTVGYMGTGTVTIGAGQVFAGTVQVGSGTPGPVSGEGTLEVSGGDLIVSGRLEVGHYWGNGTVSQTGGDVSADSMIIGKLGDADQVAEYTQTGGTNTVATDLWVGGGPDEHEAKGRYVLGGSAVLAVGRNLKVGSQGLGTVEHENGTATVVGSLLLGGLTGRGTYKLGEPGGSDPSLIVASHVALGLDNLSAMGTFLHWHGTHTVEGSLYVGMEPGPTGTYNLLAYDSVLDVWGEAYVGYLGTGNVLQEDGTFTVGTNLTLGHGNGATGTYVIRDGTLDVSNGIITVGVNGDATFEFDVESPDQATVIADEFVLGPNGQFLSEGKWSTLRVNQLTGFGLHPEFAGSVEFGHSGGAGIGGYEIIGTGSTFTCGGDLVVGYDAGGTFEQCRSLSQVTADGLVLGEQPGGYGTYTLDAYSAVLTTGHVGVARGMFHHLEGTHTVTNAGAATGMMSIGPGGTYEMSDGTLNGHSLSVSASSLDVAAFQQTGGNVTFDEEMVIGAAASLFGTYEKTGGTLDAGSMVVGGSGSGMFILRNSNATFTGDVVVAEDANEDPYPPSSGTIDVEVGRFSCAMLEVGRDGSRPGVPSVGTVRQGAASRVECTTLRLAYGGEATYTMDDGTFTLTTDTVHVGWSGTAHFIQNAGTHTATSLVEIGGHVISEVWHGDGEGDYTMMGGTLLVPTLVVGETSIGRLTQGDGSDSTVTATNVTLGRVSDGDGTYTLYEGRLECESLIVGDAGTGTFHHGDTVTATNFIAISSQVGSHGTYNLDSGDLSANLLRVGGGQVTDGTFNWYWGTLDAPTVQVWQGGTMNVANSWAYGGTLEVDGGVLDMGSGTQSLWLDAPGDGAQMLIAGGSAHSLNLTVGITDKATVTQTGGTNNVDGFLEVGVGPGSEGIYDLQGGGLNVGTLIIGGGGQVVAPPQGGELDTAALRDNGDGSGHFTWTGGALVADTVEVNTNGTMDVGVTWARNGTLGIHGGSVNTTGIGTAICLGTGGTGDEGGTGVIEIDAGTLNANTLCVGYDGTGIVNQIGGTVTGNLLWVGHQGPGYYYYESGDLTMNSILVRPGGTMTAPTEWTYAGGFYVEGGSLDLVNTSLTLDAPGDGATADLSGGWTETMEEYVGYAAKATITQTGGDHLIGGALYLGHEVGSEGIYHLEGGTLTVPEIYVGVQGSALLRWTGGTLDAQFITVGPGGEFALALTAEYEGDLYCPDGGKVTVELGSEVTLSGMFGIDPGAAFGKDGEGTLIIDGPQQHGDGASFDILGGTVDMNTDAGQGGFVDVSILVDDAVLFFGCDQYLDTLALDNGALVRFTGANVVVVQHLVMDGIDLGAATLTPEPATLALLAAGALALLARRRRPAHR